MGYFDDLIPGAGDGTGFSPQGRDPRRFGSGALDGLGEYDLDMARAAMSKHTGQPESAAARAPGQGTSADAMSTRRPQTIGTGQSAMSRPPAVGSRLPDNARMGSHPDDARGSGPAPVRSLSVSIDNGQTVIHGADVDTVKRIAAGLSEKVSPLRRSNGTFILPKRFETEVRDALAGLMAIDEGRAARRPPGQGPSSGSDEIDRSSQSLAPRNSGNRKVLSTNFEETVDDPRLAGLNATVNKMLKNKTPISAIADYVKHRGGDPTKILSDLINIDDYRRKYPMYKGNYVVDMERISVPVNLNRSIRSAVLGVSPARDLFREDEKISGFKDQITIGTSKKSVDKPKELELGALSAKYESRGDVGAVSTGKDDSGGVSYGSYQLNTALVAHFLKSPQARAWFKDFENLKPATKEFGDKWKEVAIRDPVEFEKAQHEYVSEERFYRVARSVKNKIGYDFNDSKDTIKNIVWSLSTQHGEAADILFKAIGDTDKSFKRSDPRYEENLIENIYDRRYDHFSRVIANKIAIGEFGEAKNLKNSRIQRTVDERIDARRMLKLEMEYLSGNGRR